MEILAIIPARGGSKGIPHKNIKLFNGAPLISYTINHAINTPEITRTVVSTDDPEIELISKEYGAEVIIRPSQLATDEASSESALLHVLEHLHSTEGYRPDIVVFLQATSPIRKDNDITEAINKFIETNADSLFSVTPFHGFVWREYASTLFISHNYNSEHRPRRQDTNYKDYLENGSIYIFKPKILEIVANRLGGTIKYYIQGIRESFQIDTPEDFEFLELISKNYQK